MNPDLLALLVCPATRRPLRYDPETRELVSDAAGLAFPIREGVPILLVDEARPIPADPGATAADRPRSPAR
jgi:uncharacterized protein YbaR (Trm112 family)